MIYWTMPNGRQQEPGGGNRIVLLVQDSPARIDQLKNQGVHFRNETEIVSGGRIACCKRHGRITIWTDNDIERMGLKQCEWNKMPLMDGINKY